MPAASDIAEYLEDQGHGTVGVDIFAGAYPDSPDNLVTVIQTQGLPPHVVEAVEFPGIQVIVRNTDYDTAVTNINAIFKLLHQLTHTTMETRVYHRIDAQGSPAGGQEPEKLRWVFVCSFIVIKGIE